MSFLKFQLNRIPPVSFLLLWCIPAFILIIVALPGTLQTQENEHPSIMKMTLIETAAVRKKTNTDTVFEKSLNEKKIRSDVSLNNDRLNPSESASNERNEPILRSVTESTDSPPKIDFKKPEYPVLSRKLAEEGDVFAVITVSENDVVIKVDIERSSGYLRLDNAVIKALKGAKVVSAVRNGKKVAETLHLGPFQFRLVENSK